MPKSNFVCPHCGFKAKSAGGLRLHVVNKEECREAIGEKFFKKSAKKSARKKSRGKKRAEIAPQRPVLETPSGVEEELVDEIDILREIFINEGIQVGRENIINSLKRGDIYDLYDLNEIMRERGISPYKRRGIIRAWADASELDIPEELGKDLRMRSRRSRDYGVSPALGRTPGKRRARRVEELRERKYDRLEDLALKREIKEQQKELTDMEKGKEGGKEKKSMMLVPFQQKDGSTTYQPVNVPKEYAAMSPMINPFMMNPAQFQKSDRGNEELRKRFEKGNEEARKRFEKLETMMEKMREDREHKAIRDDVHRLTERLERRDTEDKGGAWREELRELRAKLDDERYNALRDALAHKLRELDARTRHGELDMYSKVSDKLENLGVSGSKKSREEHEMELERTKHKKGLNMLEELLKNQYRGIQHRVDDIAEVLKPAAKLLVMERAREEGKKKGKTGVPKKYSEKELQSIEKALRTESGKGAKKQGGKGEKTVRTRGKVRALEKKI